MASQPARLRTMLRKPTSRYGASRASMPPIFWMSSVASSWTTSTMSSTVTMPFTCRSASMTGMARKSCSANRRERASWSMLSGAGTTSGLMMSRTFFSGEEPLALRLGCRLHDVGGVVRREEPHPRAPLARRRLEDQLRLVAGGKRQQQVLGVGVREEAEPLQTLLGGENGPRLRQLRGEEAPLPGPLDRGRRHEPPLAGRGTLATSSPPGAGGMLRARAVLRF